MPNCTQLFFSFLFFLGQRLIPGETLTAAFASALLSGFESSVASRNLTHSLDRWGCDAAADILVINFCANEASGSSEEATNKRNEKHPVSSCACRVRSAGSCSTMWANLITACNDGTALLLSHTTRIAQWKNPCVKRKHCEKNFMTLMLNVVAHYWNMIRPLNYIIPLFSCEYQWWLVIYKDVLASWI